MIQINFGFSTLLCYRYIVIVFSQSLTLSLYLRDQFWVFFSRSIVDLEKFDASFFSASSLVFVSSRLYCGCLLYSFGAKYRASNFFSVKSTLVYLLVHSQTLIIGGFSLEKLDFGIWQIFMYAGYELPFLLYHHWIIVLGVNPLEKLNIS